MDSVQKHTYVLILAGGGGTRLWPLSREETPKQFSKLFAGKSLFEITLERALKIVSPSRIYVSTSVKYQSLVKKIAKSVPDENIIAEPMRRDTALAHALAAAIIHKKDPLAVIVNFASDHLITPQSTFTRQIKAAAKAAFENDYSVTIGIKPKFPHTGMGHIKAVKKWPGSATLLLGEKFVEKPPLAVAQKYTASGNYYWNANLYVFQASLFLALIQKNAPKTYAPIPRIIESFGTQNEREVMQQGFQMAPSISIDYAISEKLHKFICIPAEFTWTDVGDWNEVWKNLHHDDLGNVIEGPAGKGEYIGLNSKNNLLFLDKKLVATVGLENMLVVDTPDALLICPKGDAQAVKKIVEILKEKKLLEYI